jgi:hypothetical protein
MAWRVVTSGDPSRARADSALITAPWPFVQTWMDTQAIHGGAELSPMRFPKCTQGHEGERLLVITSMRARTPGISALPCRDRVAVPWVVEVKPIRYGDVSRQVGTALHGRRTGVAAVREAGSPSSQTGPPSFTPAAFWEGLAVR